jgi:hypothetical protein
MDAKANELLRSIQQTLAASGDLDDTILGRVTNSNGGGDGGGSHNSGGPASVSGGESPPNSHKSGNTEGGGGGGGGSAGAGAGACVVTAATALALASTSSAAAAAALVSPMEVADQVADEEVQQQQHPRFVIIHFHRCACPPTPLPRAFYFSTHPNCNPPRPPSIAEF